MPPGRVAPNGGTRTQGSAVQIGSERAGAGPDCERADCDTNNAASLKEAHVDHRLTQRRQHVRDVDSRRCGAAQQQHFCFI